MLTIHALQITHLFIPRLFGQIEGMGKLYNKPTSGI